MSDAFEVPPKWPGTAVVYGIFSSLDPICRRSTVRLSEAAQPAPEEGRDRQRMSNMIVQLQPEAAGAMGGEYTSASSPSSSPNAGVAGGGSTGGSTGRRRGVPSSRSLASRGGRWTEHRRHLRRDEDEDGDEDDGGREQPTTRAPQATRTDETLAAVARHRGQRLINATKPAITLSLDPDAPTVQLPDDDLEDEEEVEDRDPDEAYLSSIVSDSSPPEKPPSLPQ
ncbi:hypothetical protein BC830DRAFT_56223, partial [Chytriomyces sp. MP71]